MDLRFSATLNPKLRKKQLFSFPFKKLHFVFWPLPACLLSKFKSQPSLFFSVPLY
ncbi:hypothetical protein Patl1_32342 [Pistacia atlantica]|uniref:Uncharacterized protein n=1 Tax=Pistacia atlantica TaxID=434234 RepID=A0ACC1AN19_9ROSI|nr:hypothetical protein Patl1_32342 [Pistacia atlantica]